MKCPNCNAHLDDETILSMAASIQGARSSRRLSKKASREMQKKSVESRKRNRKLAEKAARKGGNNQKTG